MRSRIGRGQLVIEIVGFQLVWLVAVAGAARGIPWAGPVSVLLWAAYHVFRSSDRRPWLRWLSVCALLGYVLDSALTLGGWLAFPELTRLLGPSPLWMVALWVNFGVALIGPLRWLTTVPVLSALLGAASGPLAYWGGERLGALSLGTLALPMVAVEWGLALPILLGLLQSRWICLTATPQYGHEDGE